jgi:hypothetical protein
MIGNGDFQISTNLPWTVHDILKSKVSILQQKEELESLFIRACSTGDFNTVKECLDKKLNINSFDDTHTPALIYCCCFRHFDILKLLLEHGADPNIQDSRGWTPLLWAKTNDFVKGIELLLQAGAETTNDKTIDDISNTLDSMQSIDLEMDNFFHSKFDWDFCRPSQMLVFEESMMERILDIAISRVIPSKKKFSPVGANVLFLSARYACHHHSAELTFTFLSRAIEKIVSWIDDSHDIFTCIYWLSNCFQLQVYLKRDTTLLVSTLENQCQLADAINHIFDILISILFELVIKQSNAILEHGVDKTIRFDVDFFGLGKRKTILKQHQSALGVFNRLFEQIPTAVEVEPQNIINIFVQVIDSCSKCMLNPLISFQVFQSVFRQLNNYLIEQLLENKSLCCRSRAQQIQLNLSMIQQWIKENKTLKNFGINVTKLLEEFSPSVGLFQFLQVATTIRSVSELKEVLESFHAPIVYIHTVMSQYRFESNEQSFQESIELYVQKQYEVVGNVKEPFEMVQLNLPLKHSAFNEWKSIPSIPQIVIEMMDS